MRVWSTRSIVVLTFALAAACVHAENWPGWRGPRGDGGSQETDVPIRWSAEDNIAWSVPLPYTGHASPVVWKDRVFVVGADEKKNRRMLVCLDRLTGKTVWERAVFTAPLETKHSLNSYASGTPATDGKVVYVTFMEVTGRTVPAPNVGRARPITPGVMVVAAYDFNGKMLWRVKPGGFISAHGFCTSPVLYRDKVIVNGDHDGDSYIAALDRKTGRTLWKVDREGKTRSYCTPIIRTFAGRTQMILSGSKCLASYSPDTGKRYWIFDGPTEQWVASPVENAGLVFFTGGFPDKHILAIDPTGSGRINHTPHVKWRHYRRGVSYVPSPVAAGRFFFIVSDNGIGSCYDAVTGKRMWMERMGRRYSASLVATANHVYFLNDDGECQVVAVAPEFKIVAVNKLGERVSASPAISRGQLFIRSERQLYCIGRTTK